MPKDVNRWAWSGYLLGFALGGFDGILLHQILQWHHLLSGLEADGLGDIRVQVLADGLFHALMYVIAAVGLWLLVRARRQAAAPGSERALMSSLLIGFGAWHVADTLLSHWLLGIHRIRMDAIIPLAWDLLWLFAFGLLPAFVGVRLRRMPRSGNRGGGPVAASVALAALVSGWLAGQPPAEASSVVVDFSPATTPAAVLAAATAVDAKIVWVDGTNTLWAFEMADADRASEFYSHGAWLVGSTLLPAGCLTWSRAG